MAARSRSSGNGSGRRVREIHFHVPGLKHYETADFAQRNRREFVAISLTGRSCALLLEGGPLAPEGIGFDEKGRIARLDVDGEELEPVILSGLPFMTAGCPGEDGSLACNRPFGSYRPGQPFRDYPFPPTGGNIRRIVRQLR